MIVTSVKCVTGKYLTRDKYSIECIKDKLNRLNIGIVFFLPCAREKRLVTP